MFVELMHHLAGVRTITVGGLPQPGPIQAASGSRGAQMYHSFDLDEDIEVASALNDTAANILPQDRADLNFTMQSATFNLRDQIRQGEDFPLQFAYQAADCRIFWTQNSINNFTDLWSRAATAIWDNPSLCIADSTNFSSSDTDTLGPSENFKQAWSKHQTVAQYLSQLGNNHTSSNFAYGNDTSSLASWIMGGLGGEIDDAKKTTSGWNGNTHNGQHQSGGSGSGSSCGNCGQGAACIRPVSCTSGTYNVAAAQPTCVKVCKPGQGTRCPGHCNRNDRKCTGGSKAACQTLTTQAFCLPTPASCPPSAFSSAQAALQTAKSDHPYVFIVKPGK